MPRLVKGPDGTIHSFPDDAKDSEISAALEAIPQANAPKATSARTWTDTAVDLLPTLGGIAGGILGGIGGTVGGLGVGGVPGAVAGAAVGGAGGEGWKQAINYLRGKPETASSSEAAGKIAGQAALQGGSELAGAGLSAGMAAAAPRLMQAAVKPTQAVLEEYRTTAPKIVQTLLDEGVNVSRAGAAKLQGLISETNDKIRDALISRDELLQRLGLDNAVIDKKAVASRALQTANKVAQQVDPARDLQTVGETAQAFLDHPVFNGPRLTLPDAQRLKVGTYQQIGKKYGEVSSAAVETQKALARGLKEDIAAEVPAVANLNARDGELMAALDAVGRRAAMSGNRDPIGFAWVAQHPTTFLAALMDRSPAVKSYLARGLYQSAAAAGKVSPQLLKAALAAVASGESSTTGTPEQP